MTRDEAIALMLSDPGLFVDATYDLGDLLSMCDAPDHALPTMDAGWQRRNSYAHPLKPSERKRIAVEAIAALQNEIRNDTAIGKALVAAAHYWITDRMENSNGT